MACGGEKLTLVVDEAVGGEQLEGVDLEQDSVEQKVVSRRTDLGFVTQTRLCELLQEATYNYTQCDPVLGSINLRSGFDSWPVLS